MRSLALKRAMDVIGSLFGLLVMGLPMLAISILVRWRLGSPVIFIQERAGLHGRPFKMFKFRTMSQATDESGALLPDAQRTDRFGRLLRSTSLDELPELFNVLRGDMSLVGPRPLYVKYLPRYSKEQARRHDVKPGLTGWSQINGRNATSWPNRFALDLWYVDHWSNALDLEILLRTFPAVLAQRDVNPKDRGTMPEFMGET